MGENVIRTFLILRLKNTFHVKYDKKVECALCLKMCNSKERKYFK